MIQQRKKSMSSTVEIWQGRCGSTTAPGLQLERGSRCRHMFTSYSPRVNESTNLTGTVVVIPFEDVGDLDCLITDELSKIPREC